jgi:hypothetical protein
VTYYDTIALLIAIFGWPISSYFAYRWGLRSQEQAAKLKARNEAISIIDRILAEIWDNRSMWGGESKSKIELRKVTIQFSSQFPEADRVRIKKALDDYQKLYVASFDYPAKGTPEREKFDKEHKAMVDGLKKLRDEISDT